MENDETSEPFGRGAGGGQRKGARMTNDDALNSRAMRRPIVIRHSDFVIFRHRPAIQAFLRNPANARATVSPRDAMNLLANDEQGELFSD